MPRRDGHKRFDARTPAEARERKRKMRDNDIVSIWWNGKWQKFEAFVDRVDGEDENGTRRYD